MLAEPKSTTRGYVFISYAREDVVFARRVRIAVEDAGFEVWFDEQIQCGEQWASILDNKLAHAGCVVVIWSNQAVGSTWVRHEASHAIARGVYTPCRIEMDSIPIPAPYNQIQATDLFDWREDDTDHPGLRDVLRRIAELIPPEERLVTRVAKLAFAQRFTIMITMFALATLALLVWQTWALRSQLAQSRVQVSRMGEQISLSQQSLDEVGRIVTRFNTIVLDLVFELPSSDPGVKQLLSHVERSVLGNASSEAVHSIFTGHFIEHYVDLERMNKESFDVNDTYILEFLCNPKIVIGISTDAVPLDSFALIVNKAFAKNHVFPRPPVWAEPAAGLPSPAGKIDLFAVSRKNDFKKILHFSPVSGRVFVRWNRVRFPQEEWRTNGRIVSLRDLEHTQFSIAVWHTIDYRGSGDLRWERILKGMAPLWMNVAFDNHAVTIDEFDAPASPIAPLVHKAILPAFDRLLSGGTTTDLPRP
jgi:hypothetical protein